jgi:hypothetical protein
MSEIEGVHEKGEAAQGKAIQDERGEREQLSLIGVSEIENNSTPACVKWMAT